MRLNLILLVMKYCYILLLTLASCWDIASAQKDTSYLDIITDRDRVWALTTKGKLSVFDLRHLETSSLSIPYDDSIVVIAIDRRSAIVVCDSSGHIRRYDEGPSLAGDRGLQRECLCTGL